MIFLLIVILIVARSFERLDVFAGCILSGGLGGGHLDLVEDGPEDVGVVLGEDVDRRERRRGSARPAGHASVAG